MHVSWKKLLEALRRGAKLRHPLLFVKQGANQFELGMSLLLMLIVVYLAHTLAKWPGPIAVAQESAAVARTSEALPPLADNANLFFTSVDLPALAVGKATKLDNPAGPLEPLTEVTRLMVWGAAHDKKTNEKDQTTTGNDAETVTDKLFLAPNGRQVAVQTWFGSRPLAWLLNLSDRHQSNLTRLTGIGWSIFLGWHPDSKQVLVRVEDLDVPDPGLWIVNTVDGSHERVNTPELVAPEGLLAAAFAPDGKTIIYATSKGMGFGSEVWVTDLKNQKPQLLYKDELTIISNLAWSPDGQSIAFVNLLDSPVPFAKAGLWRMNADGAEPKLLAIMDGGHGQVPVWSRDSVQLYFVARENFDNPEADDKAEALVSSIRSVNVQTGEASTIVPANGARQIDLSLTATGDLLFASNRQGALELWSLNATGKLQQLTSDGEAKRYPLFVPAVAAQ